ncbi:hypothetical protein PUN28_010726 [Cardiocondyla obscurior]|uniref:Uncharacterized protein n=1 Tax=Cardiocondyla obscurior TaxID=286306 RepID=A0AAW2FKU7_9HYME
MSRRIGKRTMVVAAARESLWWCVGVLHLRNPFRESAERGTQTSEWGKNSVSLPVLHPPSRARSIPLTPSPAYALPFSFSFSLSLFVSFLGVKGRKTERKTRESSDRLSINARIRPLATHPASHPLETKTALFRQVEFYAKVSRNLSSGAIITRRQIHGSGNAMSSWFRLETRAPVS